MTILQLAKSDLAKIGAVKRPNLLSYVRRILAEFVQRKENAGALDTLSEKQLRDIGITRSNVASIRNLPLQESASTALVDARKIQSGNW